MRNRNGIVFFLAGILLLTVLSAGCSDNGQSGTTLTTVPTTALTAKFFAGDIIAKTAISTDTFLLIVKYDAATDRYERALAYKKSDGSWYRKDDRTEVVGRSVIERIYPAKVAHVVSLSEVPVVTLTAATTAPTLTVTTTTTTSYPAPTVSSITPNTGLAGTTITITSISGTNFRPGATVMLVNETSTSTISGTSVTAQSASNITCLFSIPSGAIAGTWNVTVTNYDGQVGALANAFTIMNTTTTTTTTTTPPAITVTSITPNTGVNGTTVSITNLGGTNFQTGATVNLTRLGSQNITASGVLASTSQIICTFALPSNAAVGSWNVVVTNPSGQSGTLANGFTVKNPAPMITSIIPNSNVTGLFVDITDLEGMNFQPDATVRLHSDSFDITATNVVVVSATKITCTFDLGSASAGLWDVVVTNPDTQSVTLLHGFESINP